MKGKEILIIGGTGTLGNALILELIKHNPRGIRIYSRDELKQSEQKKSAPNGVSYIIGDIRDKDRLSIAMRGVDIVINCAALKQIETGENDPMEVIKTNVLGVTNVVETSIQNNIEYVVQISTDKACYPVNLYGATKLAAEKLIQNASTYGGNHRTKFCVFRYGNVIGSRGSVIPLFKKQAKEGSLTITDASMTRFLIRIEYVAEFIINTLLNVKTIDINGSIYIPIMKSTSIGLLADTIIKQMNPDAKIEIIGARDSEKYHETIVTHEEGENCELSIKHNLYRIHKSISSNATRMKLDSKIAIQLENDELIHLIKDI